MARNRKRPALKLPSEVQIGETIRMRLKPKAPTFALLGIDPRVFAEIGRLIDAPPHRVTSGRERMTC